MKTTLRSKTKNRIIMRKYNHGQAAIEFLVTYGWAILGALITISALAYFGIFNTQKYVDDVCYFGDQMTCEDYMAQSDGTVALRLRNNFGVPMDITNATIKSDYGTSDCGTSISNIQPGNSFDITCDIGSQLSQNNKLKYKATITFRRTGSTNEHNQTGDVTITVQP